MADFSKFRSLEAEEQVLVAVSILVLGADTQDVFDKSHADYRSAYLDLLKEIMSISANVRLPYLGTILRNYPEQSKALIKKITGKEQISENPIDSDLLIKFLSKQPFRRSA